MKRIWDLRILANTGISWLLEGEKSEMSMIWKARTVAGDWQVGL